MQRALAAIRKRHAHLLAQKQSEEDSVAETQPGKAECLIGTPTELAQVG